MATNMHGKKVQSHQDDEVKYIFTPTKQSYNNDLKNILLQTRSRKEEKAWANRAGLVGMFEVECKTTHQNIMVEL